MQLVDEAFPEHLRVDFDDVVYAPERRRMSLWFVVVGGLVAGGVGGAIVQEPAGSQDAGAVAFYVVLALVVAGRGPLRRY